MQHCFKNPVVVHVCNPTTCEKERRDSKVILGYITSSRPCLKTGVRDLESVSMEKNVLHENLSLDHITKNLVLIMCSYNSNALEWKAKARRPSLGLSNYPFSSRGSVRDCLKGIR